MIPGNANSLLLRPSATAYSIPRSLRFNSSDSAYLSRTPASAGTSLTTSTMSMWVKRSTLGANAPLFSAGSDTSDYLIVHFQSDSTIRILTGENGSTNQNIVATSAVFRDTSAWYHFLIQFDFSNSVSADRIKLYVNGSRVTLSGTFASQGYTGTRFNRAFAHSIGKWSDSTTYFSGYLADIHFIDGQALTPTSFGEFDATTGVWNPKAYTGSYGTNGFRLPFSDNSAATATTLGKDTSGNGNNWTPVNLQAATVTLPTYVTPGTTTASSGTVANGSTPYWIDILPTNASLAYSGAMANVHDGDLNTSVYWVGDDYASGNVTRARFDLRDFPVVSSVRIYAAQYYTGSPYTPYSVRLLDSSKSPIAGTSQVIDNTTAAWLTVSVAGAPAYIEFYLVSPNAERLFLHEIEVNGVRLVSNTISTSDSLVDSPTNGTASSGGDAGGVVVGNYCTLNPLISVQALTLVNGNLETSSPGAAWRNAKGTFGMTSGKWYWEHTVPTTGAADGYIGGVATAAADYSSSSTGVWGRQGTTKYSNGTSSTSFGSTTSGDILGFAFDADAGKLWVAQNGTWVGDPAAGTGESWSGIPSGVFPYVAAYNRANVVNFGQRSFAYSNGRSGFKSLNTANLPTPTILKGSSYFDTKLYTGNGSTQTISGLGFSPDFVWVKQRDTTNTASHVLVDIVRGNNNVLRTNGTDAENGTDINPATYDGITNLSTSSFDVVKGSSGTYNGTNGSSKTYVAWAWDAGSSTVTNTQGSITSTVRANASAGFSVVTYTGTGANATVGHGLGVKPGLIIARTRNVVANWCVYHVTTGASQSLSLNSTAAAAADTSRFQGVEPTSTVFSVGNTGDLNLSSSPCLAYCFAPVSGYSSFGSYTGNGSADGPFVFCNFRPRWLLIKSSSAAGESWFLLDSARSLYNVTQDYLVPNSSASEASAYNIVDLLSNGFKLRTSGGGSAFNGSGATYIYAAFAENPFSIARAR